MKIKSYKALFRLFAFLADKTGGFPPFVKYKLALGTLLVGLAACSSNKNKTPKAACYDMAEPDPKVSKANCYLTSRVEPDTSNVAANDSLPLITCYDPVYIADETVYDIEDVEEKPVFAGGYEALHDSIQMNLMNLMWSEIPASGRASCYDIAIPKGRVDVRFIITKEGKVRDPEIIRGWDAWEDRKALQVVSLLQGWIPGKVNGEPVDVYYHLPVMFGSEQP